jgi:hypothetical protein
MPYFQRGVAYKKKGDESKAEEDFARAKQLDPKSANWTR